MAEKRILKDQERMNIYHVMDSDEGTKACTWSLRVSRAGRGGANLYTEKEEDI